MFQELHSRHALGSAQFLPQHRDDLIIGAFVISLASEEQEDDSSGVYQRGGP